MPPKKKVLEEKKEEPVAAAAQQEKAKRVRKGAKAAADEPVTEEPVPAGKVEEKVVEAVPAPVEEKPKKGRKQAKAAENGATVPAPVEKAEEKKEDSPAPVEEKPKKGRKPGKAAAENTAAAPVAEEKAEEKIEEPAPAPVEEKPKKGRKTGKAAAEKEGPAPVPEDKVEEKMEEPAPAPVEEKPKKGRKPAKVADDNAAPVAAEKAEEKMEEDESEPAPVEEKPKKGRKPAKAADEDGVAPAKKSKADKMEEKSKLRKEASLTDGMDFSHTCKTKDGREPNWKIASWNINGIRAWLDKGGLSYLRDEKPDILCVQETKCALDDMPDDVKVDGYYAYWSSADQAGYAGTGIYSKTEPVTVSYGIGKSEHDSEGRVITAEYEKFYLVNAYVPNSGRGLPRLPYRSKKWDVDFREYLNNLNKTKPVIMCGDLNVAHQEIDLANPKTNKKTAGFTVEERQGFTDLLAEGYIDSFRELYPEVEGAYSFWTYMGNARGKNVGWRLDYFVLSERLKEDLCDSIIRKDVMGSDHCPIVLFMAFK